MLEKRLCKNFWWGIESIVLKLLSGVSTFLIDPIAAEKSAIQFLTNRKRHILYKKSSRKTTLHDIYQSYELNTPLKIFKMLVTKNVAKIFFLLVSCALMFFHL